MNSYLKTEMRYSRRSKRVICPLSGCCDMNVLSIARRSSLSVMKEQFILRSLRGVHSAHLDLLRLASAAAA